MNSTRTRRMGLLCLLFCCVISVSWGFHIERASPSGMQDFKGVYSYARCLLQYRDPYQAGEPLRVYLAEAGSRTEPSDVLREILSLNMYLPTAFVFTVPFAMLPWGAAQLLWMIVTAASLILAAFLMGNLGVDYAPVLSVGLIGFLLANSEALFATGNPAGIAVCRCVTAVWCFLKGRFVPAGILCLALSLAIKPHDAGLVWLYFLLAGGVYRRRALQTLAMTVVLGLPAVLWVTLVSPHWMQELRSNLLTAAAPGGQLNLGPASAVSGSGPSMRIDLQSAISLVWSDPSIYLPASYMICAAFLLVWAFALSRANSSPAKAWLALAAIVPIAILITYHRPYDAKLLLLTVPACAMLWAGGGAIGWIAFLATAAGIVSTGDVPLVILDILTRNLHLSSTGQCGQILAALLTRPVPFILLAMGIFYLWAYWRRDATSVQPA
ncbi:MAG: glycosyltransferase family 87 protein [Terracidiphilus sp.]